MEDYTNPTIYKPIPTEKPSSLPSAKPSEPRKDNSTVLAWIFVLWGLSFMVFPFYFQIIWRFGLFAMIMAFFGFALWLLGLLGLGSALGSK
jgi:hypothetical protein